MSETASNTIWNQTDEFPRNSPIQQGICMDINPHKFLAPWDAYEFARACLAAQSPIVALSMAWLTRQSADELAAAPQDADAETLAYWLERFHPLLDLRTRPYDAPPIIVIMANRCGTEGGVAYAGTSTVMKIERGKTQIFDILGKGEEKLLVVDLNEVSVHFAYCWAGWPDEDYCL